MIFNLRITKKCNRRCNYCTITDYTQDGDTEQIIETIHFLIDNGVDVGIYGGEVFLHNDIDIILKDFHHKLNIITNGDFITDPRMKLFKNILVSLHDEFNLENIMKFENHEIKITKYLVVYTKETFKEINETYINLSTELKNKIRLIPYKNKKMDNYFLTIDDLNELKKINLEEYVDTQKDTLICAMNKKISNIDFIKNTITYCCMSHYSEPLNFIRLKNAILNNIDKTSGFDIYKQLKDCELCTKKW